MLVEDRMVSGFPEINDNGLCRKSFYLRKERCVFNSF